MGQDDADGGHFLEVLLVEGFGVAGRILRQVRLDPGELAAEAVEEGFRSKTGDRRRGTGDRRGIGDRRRQGRGQ